MSITKNALHKVIAQVINNSQDRKLELLQKINGMAETAKSTTKELKEFKNIEVQKVDD